MKVIRCLTLVGANGFLPCGAERPCSQHDRRLAELLAQLDERHERQKTWDMHDEPLWGEAAAAIRLLIAESPS